MSQLQSLSNVLANASSAVGTLLNAAAPINMLPPELLSHIFMLHVTEEKREGTQIVHPFSLPSPKAALRLGLVCKHWRSMVLSTSFLWSGIICGGPDNTPYMNYVGRSRSAPLYVLVQDDVESAAELFRDEPSRIQHLLMKDTVINWCRRWDPRNLLSIVAPDLKSCTLNLHFWPRGALPEVSYSLFSGQAQDLRNLSIYNARIIPTDDFPNITHLLLDHLVGVPALPDILSLLSRCPQLQDILIHSARETALPQQYLGSANTVYLPYLRRLRLRLQHSI